MNATPTQLDVVNEIFASPVIFTEVSAVDRHRRKPNGTEDQGHKDEND